MTSDIRHGTIERAQLCRHLPFDWQFDEPLARHTTYQIGGPAEALLIPHSTEEIQRTVRYCNAEGIPWQVIGQGSNLLVRDEGVAGVVLAIKDRLAAMRLNGTQITCGAGLSLGALARAAADRNLAGLECLSEIPGTLGGAVFMNAGAYGQNIADSFLDALLMDREGSTFRASAADMQFGYRRSVLQQQPLTVLEVRLKLRPGRKEELWAVMREKAALRAERFPLELPNAGSVFKRPEAGYPGAWIERAGLKGVCRGGAQISERHANFIVNRGGATARDVMALMELARRSVEEKFGVILEREQRII